MKGVGRLYDFHLYNVEKQNQFNCVMKLIIWMEKCSRNFEIFITRPISYYIAGQNYGAVEINMEPKP